MATLTNRIALRSIHGSTSAFLAESITMIGKFQELVANLYYFLKVFVNRFVCDGGNGFCVSGILDNFEVLRLRPGQRQYGGEICKLSRWKAPSLPKNFLHLGQ
jgi:hypothetical protein